MKDYRFPSCIKPQFREGDLGITVFIIFIVDLVVTAALIGALLYPSYHYTTMSFVTGATLNFNVGLFTVQISGTPTGWVEAITQPMIKSFISQTINALSNHSLADFQAHACSFDESFNHFIPNGCNAIISLRVASYLLVSFLIIAALFLASGGVTLLSFWLSRRTLWNRRLALILHTLSGFSVIVGLAIYVLVGGTNVNFAFNIPGIVTDITQFDLSSGFLAAIGTSILCLTIPTFMYFFLPEDVCVDSKQQYEIGEIHEDNSLVEALNYERQQFNMYSPIPQESV